MIEFYPTQSMLNEIKGTSLESELKRYALDAYIMSAKKDENGKVFRGYYGFYDIGVVRCIFEDEHYPDGKYHFMGLESLIFPDM